MHVPYKGSGQMVQALLAGDIQIGITATASTGPHLKTGAIRLLATTTKDRSRLTPDIISQGELGFPEHNFAGESAYFAPLGTPRPIIDKLSGILAKAVVIPDVVQRAETFGVEMLHRNPEQTLQVMRADVARFVAGREAAGRPWRRDPDGSPHFPPVDRERPAADVEARLRAGEPHALRLDMRKAMGVAGPLDWRESGGGARQLVPAEPEAWGDVVLAGRETPTSYHLSVVVDDALQEVTDVVRGRDIFAATSVHRLLQKLLGLPAPRYLHHRLIVDGTGRKLAKSSGDTGLAELRAAGVAPAEVRARVGLDHG